MTYDREALVAELRRDEGERLIVYRDSVGKRTIGVGRNLDAKRISKSETAELGITLATVLKSGITRPQMLVLLRNDIDEAEDDLDRSLPWWRKLDPVRQRVLLNMAFNMGAKASGAGLLSFTNTLRAIEAGDWSTAVFGMRRSRWHSQVGQRAIRLENMMLTGATA